MYVGRGGPDTDSGAWRSIPTSSASTSGSPSASGSGRRGRAEPRRLRTWDLFRPVTCRRRGGCSTSAGRGPGVHASHLAGRGYDVTLIDPMLAHLAQRRARAEEDGHQFTTRLGPPPTSARRTSPRPTPSCSWGRCAASSIPTTRNQHARPKTRARAASRWPARGLVITRHAWTIDGTLQHVVGRPGGARTTWPGITTTGFGDPR